MEALIGIVIGAILGGISKIFVDYYNEIRERRAVAAALAAEISSTMLAIRTKQMIPYFRKLAADLRGTPPPLPWVFLDVSYESRPVAKAHIDRIGKLGPKLACRVVGFHGMMDAINLEVRILASGIYNTNPAAAARIVDRGLFLFDQLEPTAQPLIDDLIAFSGGE